MADTYMTFEKFKDDEDNLFVKLPQDMGYVKVLSEPERSIWAAAARLEFADDPDLTVFVNQLVSAMTVFSEDEGA